FFELRHHVTQPTLAFVFPGQGSQSVGMLADLADAHPQVREAFAEASEGAGVDLWALSQEGPEDQLNRTEFTQPALLAAGVAAWRCRGMTARAWSACVASGCRTPRPPVPARWPRCWAPRTRWWRKSAPRPRPAASWSRPTTTRPARS